MVLAIDVGAEPMSSPVIAFPKPYNAAVDLIDRNLVPGRADKIAIHDDNGSYTYAEVAERVGQVAAVLDAMGAPLWIVGQPVAATPNASVFVLPETPELISPLLAVVPMQVLAYQMAVEKGLNPDTFRRDNPVYKEAFGLLKL